VIGIAKIAGIAKIENFEKTSPGIPEAFSDPH
jgi:hypothetical protein